MAGVLRRVLNFVVFGGRPAATTISTLKNLWQERVHIYGYRTGTRCSLQGSSWLLQQTDIQCCHSCAGRTNPHQYWHLCICHSLLCKIQQNNSQFFTVFSHLRLCSKPANLTCHWPFGQLNNHCTASAAPAWPTSHLRALQLEYAPKFKTPKIQKINSGGRYGLSTNICTTENNPLYGIYYKHSGCFGMIPFRLTSFIVKFLFH